MKKVFIGGCDRSGTTFLAGLLSQLPNAIATPESQFKNELEFNSKDFKQDFSNHWRVANWISKQELQDIDWELDESHFYEALVEKYVNFNFPKTKVNLWIDHTPNNLQYSSKYLELWSDIKFIHIIRDGRGVASSLLPLEWGPNSVISAAHFWLEKLSYCFALEALKPEKVLRVKYEDLLENTSDELQRIYDFLSLSNVELGEAKIALPKYTQEQHKLVSKPPNKELAKNWKSKLTEEDIILFEHYASEMLKVLGYTVEGSSKAISRNLKVKMLVKDKVYKYLVNPYFYRKKRGI